MADFWSGRKVSPLLLRRALAEAIGTYGLVVAGCGAIIVNAQTVGAIAAALTLQFLFGPVADLGVTVPASRKCLLADRSNDFNAWCEIESRGRGFGRFLAS